MQAHGTAPYHLFFVASKCSYALAAAAFDMPCLPLLATRASCGAQPSESCLGTELQLQSLIIGLLPL
jgi:hypothetical protein